MLIERLGPYQLRRKIGQGGMGTVYEGFDASTGQVVAIKLLSAEMAQQAGFRERFESEIETLHKLNHPNIVRLFGFGEQGEHLFYSMEYVAGKSLEEELGRGRTYDWREVTRYSIDICRALRHAHDRGVIHRDMKPANLLVADAETIKLSDFGIARLFGNLRVTGGGSIIGTAEYMAPEQAEGRPVDPRSDLYGLGAVMYVLLARRPLFQGKSFGELLEKQRHEVPAPLRQFAPDVPAELEQIIHQLLEKDADRRPPNASVLQKRLEAMLEALSATPIDEKPPAADSQQADHSGSFVLPANPEVETPRNLSGAVPSHQGFVLDQMAPTRPATRPSPELAPPPAPSPNNNDEIVVTRVVREIDGNRPSTSPTSPAAVGRFVPVAPEELDVPETSESPAAWISPQTWALAISLLVVGVFAWYFLQPPSANKLYRRISAAVEGQKGEALAQSEDAISQFLSLYPNDVRADELREKLTEIELFRLDRNLERRARGLLPAENLIPAERAYLEALNYSWLDPEIGIAKFQAMIELHSSGKDLSGPTWKCVELAKRHLARLKEKHDLDAKEELDLVRARLDQADALKMSKPSEADAIYNAVLELYGNRPWASEMIRRANAGLTEKKGKDPGGSNGDAKLE